MKNEGFIRVIGDIEDKYIEEAIPQQQPSLGNGPRLKGVFPRMMPAAACLVALLLGTTVFAAAYIQDSISAFYLRYLWPDDMAVADALAEKYGPKVYFDGLKSDDIYQQYFAINKLVEYYNDDKVRGEAIEAITPFLANDEQKLADAAAFSLSVLTQTFDHPWIIHLADHSVVFTLFNNYSDYGSYNELWRISDGVLEKCISLNPPQMYISHIVPSPDQKLFAIVTNSNASGYIWIYDVINGFVSKELIDSARILAGKDMGYAVLQRIDFENYSGLAVDLVPDKDGILRWESDKNNIYWINNSTIEFIADLRGDVEEIEEFHIKAAVQYDFQQKQLTYHRLEK